MHTYVHIYMHTYIHTYVYLLMFCVVLFQASGEARFVDDIPPLLGELHASFVTSAFANAQINKIDPSDALVRMPQPLNPVVHRVHVYSSPLVMI